MHITFDTFITRDGGETEIELRIKAYFEARQVGTRLDPSFPSSAEVYEWERLDGGEPIELTDEEKEDFEIEAIQVAEKQIEDEEEAARADECDHFERLRKRKLEEGW